MNVVVSACLCDVLSVPTASKCPSCAFHHGSACPNTTWSQFDVPVSHTLMDFFQHLSRNQYSFKVRVGGPGLAMPVCSTLSHGSACPVLLKTGGAVCAA